MTAASQTQEISWPNLDSHGITFGIAASSDGVDRLIMIDESGGWVSLARRLGFTQSRWLGIYVREDLRLKLPNFSTTFPLGQIVKITELDLRIKTAQKMKARQNLRLSQLGSVAVRLGWKGREISKTQDATEILPATDPATTTAEVEQLLSQTIFLGFNHLAQRVEQRGDGTRTVLDAHGRLIVKEGEATQDEGALFLRVLSDADLPKIAQGLVHELEQGRRLASSDFSRYVDAAYGEGAANNQDVVTQFHDAVDQAMQDRVAARGEISHASFTFALKLHESRPPFWRAQGTLPTPAPLVVAMQALAADYIEASSPGAALDVIDIGTREGAHSFSMPSVTVSGYGGVPAHSIALGGIFSKAIAHRDISGFRATRSEHEIILNTLAARQAQGLSIFVISTETAGFVNPESRRLLTKLGQSYELTVCDLDSSLVGAGEIPPSRLLVVRNKRPAAAMHYASPSRVPVLRDYHAVWAHFDSLRMTADASSEVFAIDRDDRDENRWQAPYIPMSQATEPEAMIPRNLLAPVRFALSELVEKYQTDIDSFICEEMGWTLEHLYSGGPNSEPVLSSEQIDALALMIDATKEGGAFINSDVTGLGKGRVGASLLLWAKRHGHPAIFLTEKADLFSDIYRDISDIGGSKDLADPMIINSDARIYDLDDQEIYRSQPRDEQMNLLLAQEPPRSGIILSTYSQLNRAFSPDLASGYRYAWELVRAIDAGVAPSLDEISQRHPAVMRLGIDAQASVKLHQDAIARATAHLATSLKPAVEKAARKELEELTRSLSILEGGPVIWQEAAKLHLASAKSEQVKMAYLFSEATKNAIVILDESHNAAGESNISANIQHLINHTISASHQSATYAKRVDNMTIYKNAFPSDASLNVVQDAISFGGEPLMEVFCSMLAQSGRLIRREHDLSSVEFVQKENAKYRTRNEQWANEFGRVLASISMLSGDIAASVELANERIAKLVGDRAGRGVDSGEIGLPPGVHDTVGLQYTHFASQLYNLSRAFALTINADAVAEEAIAIVRDGKKPVIGLESTMESILVSIVSDITEGDGAPSASKAVPLGRRASFKDLLHRALDKVANVRVITRTAQAKKDPLKDQMIQLHNEKTLLVVDEIKALINAMPEIPLSPIDLMKSKIEAAGFSFGEITGRKTQLIEDENGNHVIAPLRSPKKHFVKSSFNNGETDVVLLSKTGATGISLHAGRRFKNQAQRVLLMAQRPSDVAVYQQLLGRTNRKDQVCPPICMDISSGLPAEKRQILLQNNHLRKLSANTSANADNNAIAEDVPDIINRVGDEVVFRWLSNNPKTARIIGFDPTVTSSQAKSQVGRYKYDNDKYVNLFTSRIMMLPIDEQINSWDDVLAEYKSVIEELDRLGRNPLKSSRLDIKSSVVTSLDFIAPKGSGVFSGSVQAQEISFKECAPALIASDMVTRLNDGVAQIRSTFGSIDNMRTELTEFALQRTKELLPQMLTKKHSSVAHALADTEPNAIKALSYKTSFLCDLMRSINVGSIYYFASDEDSGGVQTQSDHFLITSIECPDLTQIEGALSPARIILGGYSLEKRAYQKMSLNTLTSGVSFSDHPPRSLTDFTFLLAKNEQNEEPAATGISRSYDAQIRRYFNTASTPSVKSRERIILSGNMLSAAQYALSQNTGQIVTYTDTLGTWHHGILLPRSSSLRALAATPHVIASPADATILRRAMINGEVKRLSYGQILVLRNTEDRPSQNGESKVLYEIAIDQNGAVSLSSNKPGKQIDWFAANQSIKDCLTGGSFSIMNGNLRATILPGLEDTFFERMLECCAQEKIQMVAPSMCRSYINEHYTKASEATKQAIAATAAKDKSKDEDILSALGL